MELRYEGAQAVEVCSTQ